MKSIFDLLYPTIIVNGLTLEEGTKFSLTYEEQPSWVIHKINSNTVEYYTLSNNEIVYFDNKPMVSKEMLPIQDWPPIKLWE